MKAGLAAIVGAVRGLRRLGLEPLGRVELQSVVEEECSGNGAYQCVLSGRPADAVIVTEPTSLTIQTSQVGVLWFQVAVRGRPAHAGDAPIGLNAIEASFPVISALRALEAELNVTPPAPYDVYEHPINLNIGMIRGGDWPSTVAAVSVLHCRLALFPGASVDELKTRVEDTVAGAAAAPRVGSGRGRLRRVRLRGLHARSRLPADRRPRRRVRAGDRRPAGADRVDRDHRRAVVRALCRHPGGLLRPARGIDSRRRRARVAAVGAPERPDAGVVHRRLVRGRARMSFEPSVAFGRCGRRDAPELSLLPAHTAPPGFRAVDEPLPRRELASGVQLDVARVSGLVSEGGGVGAPGSRHVQGDAPEVDARARADVRAPRGAGRRRPARRSLPVDVPAPGVRRRLLAGGVHRRRRAGAGSQLRLSRLARGGDRVLHVVDRARRDRDERLPLGAARRGQRRGPGGVADVRRAARRSETDLGSRW